MKKINVPELNVGEKMFVSKKCVVVYGRKISARVYNLKGDLIAELPKIINKEDLKQNIFFMENTFIHKYQYIMYCVKDYDGKEIQKISGSKTLIFGILKQLRQAGEKSFYKKFRERKITSNTDMTSYGIEALQAGTTIWISSNYLILRTKKSEMKIYLKDAQGFILLGTIPKNNFGCAKSFRKILEANCHWYGLDHNMLIKEKDGWKMVDQVGENVYENISDEVMKIFMENGSEQEDNLDENVFEYNGLQVKTGETIYKAHKFFRVEEADGKNFRFYSNDCTFMRRTSDVENGLPKIIKTAEWIAICSTENETTTWQIFDYTGKILYDDIYDITQNNLMHYSAFSIDKEVPGNEIMRIFSLKGELKASFKGFRFRAYSDYVKVYKALGYFELYNYDGEKMFDVTFCEDNDIEYVGVIFHKNEKGGYTKCDLSTRKKYNLDWQEMTTFQIFHSLKVLIRKKGRYGVFEYDGNENPEKEFDDFDEVIPIKYDKITRGNCWFYARYQETDYLGKQSVYEDIYDEYGNFVMKVKV